MSSSFVHFFSRWRSSFIHFFSRYTRYVLGCIFINTVLKFSFMYIRSVSELNVNEGSQSLHMYVHKLHMYTIFRTLIYEHAHSFVHCFISLCVFLKRFVYCRSFSFIRTNLVRFLARQEHFTQKRNPLVPRSEVKCRNKDRRRKTRQGGEKRAEREAQKGTDFCSVCGLSECRYGPRG